jgi:uncharacterized membrane protein YpjA
MTVFFRSWFLLSLAAVNGVGMIWGIIWYWEQLKQAPWYLLPFVPDSPLHAMFFGFFVYWLFTTGTANFNSWQQLFSWLGVLGVIKYGLWTTVILSQYLWVYSTNPGVEEWMLYISHGGMAIQGFIYIRQLPKAFLPAVIAIIWFIANDFIDYTLFTHPRLPLPDQVAFAAGTNIALTVFVAILAGIILQTRISTSGA